MQLKILERVIAAQREAERCKKVRNMSGHRRAGGSLIQSVVLSARHKHVAAVSVLRRVGELKLDGIRARKRFELCVEKTVSMHPSMRIRLAGTQAQMLR